MKEKETKMLYHSISNINEDFIEEARKAKTKKVKRPAWIQWGMAAACILLVAATSTGKGLSRISKWLAWSWSWIGFE